MVLGLETLRSLSDLERGDIARRGIRHDPISRRGRRLRPGVPQEICDRPGAFTGLACATERFRRSDQSQLSTGELGRHAEVLDHLAANVP